MRARYSTMSAALIAAGVILAAAANALAQQPDYASRLGYPANAKLLIIHGDDLGVAHSVDEASFTALATHAISSASVIVPAPWVTEVAAWSKSHPEADLGVHIALTSEWEYYRWGPVAPAGDVQTLLDPDGYFWHTAELAGRHASADQAYTEMRDQVLRAEALGIHPTHMDTHMGTVAQTPALYAAYVKVAHEFHLPFMALRNPPMPPQFAADLSPNDIVLDHLITISPQVQPSRWMDFYRNAIENMQPGLNLMIVHLGYDNAELEAIMENHPNWGAEWRQREFDAVTSAEFRRLLQQNHIVVIGWKDLRPLME